jgi:predicted amidohydrolase
MNRLLVSLLVCLLAACASGPSRGPFTAYEGARLIVGDGRAIENGTLLVQGSRIAEAGAVRVPAGATRVNLAGKTVMPMIVDTHVHLGTTREALIRDLRQRAYYGVSAALSLGTDGYELLDMRAEEIHGAARVRTLLVLLRKLDYWFDLMNEAKSSRLPK